MGMGIKKADEGSVLILGIGLLGVCVLALVVVTDAGSAFLQRRNLYSVADAAALAGAQTIDLPSYYEHGASQGTNLDGGAAVAKARGYLAQREVIAAHPGLTVDSVTTDGVNIQVDLSIPITVPFVNALHREPARVRATARLDYRTSQ